MEYGERLQQALHLANRDRQELAAALGVSVQSIGQTLSGSTRAHTAENCAKAARFLEVDSFWLATGDGEARPELPLSWPFASIPLPRFQALDDKQKGFVEGRLLSAIEECEQRLVIDDEYQRIMRRTPPVPRPSRSPAPVKKA